MNENLKKGTLYLTISSLIFIIIGYFVNIILGRFLGPVVYGSYGVIISLISLVNVLQTSGFTQSASKYIAEDESHAPEIFRSALIIQMVATLSIFILFFLTANLIGSILNDKSLIPFIQLSSIIFPLYGYYALLIDYYNGLHNFKRQALLNILYSVTKAITVLSLAFLFQLKGVIIGLIITPIVPIIKGFYYPQKIRFHFPYKKLIFFSLPLIGYIVFSTLQQTIDLYFVKALSPGKDPGYYTASQNISRLIYFATIAISSVLLPVVSRYVKQKQFIEAKKTIYKALRMTLLIVAPSILLISMTSNQLVELIYSRTYINAGSSLAILVLGYGFFTFFTILCAILNGAGKPNISFVLSLIGVVINAVACLALIPQLNIQGAAIANLIGNMIVTIIAFVLIYKMFHVSLITKNTLKIILSSFVIYFLANVITVPLLLLPLLYLLLFLFYGLALWLLKEITSEDIALIKSVLPNWLVKRKQ